jgi:hypothetical protein
LVFIDETGTSTNMARLRGRCRRGQRLIGKVPHGHWKITTIVAALRHNAITAPFVIDEPMTGEIFRVYDHNSFRSRFAALLPRMKLLHQANAPASQSRRFPIGL